MKRCELWSCEIQGQKGVEEGNVQDKIRIDSNFGENIEASIFLNRNLGWKLDNFQEKKVLIQYFNQNPEKQQVENLIKLSF